MLFLNWNQLPMFSFDLQILRSSDYRQWVSRPEGNHSTPNYSAPDHSTPDHSQQLWPIGLESREHN